MARKKKAVIELEKEVEEKLIQFKRIFDVVVEEDINFEEYTNTVISIGLDSMLRTVIPEGQEWPMIQTAFENKYDIMCKLLADMWKEDVRDVENSKKKIRKGIEEYIR
jgi:hypothetical protein